MPSIELPESLFKRLEEAAAKLGIDDVDSLAIDILREGLARLEEELSGEAVSEEEREKIIDRLRSLGYLD